MPTRIINPFATQEEYTRFHHYVTDVIMPDCSGSAWKVLTAIIRKTLGWRKEVDRISYTQLMTATNINSTATIAKALKELLDKNYILAEPVSGHTTTIRLNQSYTVEWEEPTPPATPPLMVDVTSLESEGAISQDATPSYYEGVTTSYYEGVPLHNMKTQKKLIKEIFKESGEQRQAKPFINNNQALALEPLACPPAAASASWVRTIKEEYRKYFPDKEPVSELFLSQNLLAYGKQLKVAFTIMFERGEWHPMKWILGIARSLSEEELAKYDEEGRFIVQQILPAAPAPLSMPKNYSRLNTAERQRQEMGDRLRNGGGLYDNFYERRLTALELKIKGTDPTEREAAKRAWNFLLEEMEDAGLTPIRQYFELEAEPGWSGFPTALELTRAAIEKERGVKK